MIELVIMNKSTGQLDIISYWCGPLKLPLLGVWAEWIEWEVLGEL